MLKHPKMETTKVLLRTISIVMHKKLEILLLFQINRILFKDLTMAKICKILSLEVSMISMTHCHKELSKVKRMFRLLIWAVSLLLASLGNLMLDFRSKLVNFNNRSMTRMLLVMNLIDRRQNLKLKSISWKMMIFLNCSERNI
jgi:hypothetical protein